MSKRWVAYKVTIKDLITGEYTTEGAIKYAGVEINRAHVLGSVVSKFIGPDDKYAFLTVDDGTETLRVRSFEDSVPLVKEVSVGDVVDVIGRIRKYEDEIYIIPEIIKKVTDPNWEILRKIELLKNEKRVVMPQEKEIVSPVLVEKSVEPVVKVEKPAEEEFIETSKPIASGQTKLITKTAESPRKTIIKAITATDKGEGVDISYLMDKIGLDRDIVENVLTELMNEGTIFEPRAGKVKILE